MPATFAPTGFTVSPQANTASPAALILRAAFTSRSWVVGTPDTSSVAVQWLNPAYRGSRTPNTAFTTGTSGQWRPRCGHTTGTCTPTAPQLPPACVADGAGQRVVGEHVADLQVLDHDRLVLADESSRQLVQVVPSPSRSAYAPRAAPSPVRHPRCCAICAGARQPLRLPLLRLYLLPADGTRRIPAHPTTHPCRPSYVPHTAAHVPTPRAVALHVTLLALPRLQGRTSGSRVLCLLPPPRPSPSTVSSGPSQMSSRTSPRWTGCATRA